MSTENDKNKTAQGAEAAETPTAQPRRERPGQDVVELGRRFAQERTRGIEKGIERGAARREQELLTRFGVKSIDELEQRLKGGTATAASPAAPTTAAEPVQKPGESDNAFEKRFAAFEAKQAEREAALMKRLDELATAQQEREEAEQETVAAAERQQAYTTFWERFEQIAKANGLSGKGLRAARAQAQLMVDGLDDDEDIGEDDASAKKWWDAKFFTEFQADYPQFFGEEPPPATTGSVRRDQHSAPSAKEAAAKAAKDAAAGNKPIGQIKDPNQYRIAKNAHLKNLAKNFEAGASGDGVTRITKQ